LIEEDSSRDLNRTITVEIMTDSDLNDYQTCIENLLSASELSILEDALEKETNFESITAMTDNSSQINGGEVNGVQVTNISLVHSCSCQQFATEIVSIKYIASSM
jgi:predicted DNA-binding ArsR family transcriptional regulator